MVIVPVVRRITGIVTDVGITGTVINMAVNEVATAARPVVVVSETTLNYWEDTS